MFRNNINFPIIMVIQIGELGSTIIIDVWMGPGCDV